MNAASINFTANFIEVCESTLKSYEAAAGELEKAAALDRQTVRGIHWAIDFCKSLGRDFMTEAELKHAERLTTFRGQVCPVFRG